MTSDSLTLGDFPLTVPSQADGSSATWLTPLRNAAHSRLCEIGFPTRHNEEWRFIDLRELLQSRFAHAPKNHSLTREMIQDYCFDGVRQIVFVNGQYAPELSDVPEGDSQLLVSTLGSAIPSGSRLLETHLARYARFDAAPFVALNTSHFHDGAVIEVPRNQVVEEAIHLLFVSTNEAEAFVTHPRVLIVANENSQASFVESYVGLKDAKYFTNAVAEIVLAENAVVDHYKLQRESAAAFHIATSQIRLAKTANFSSHSLSFGADLTRNDINAELIGEGICCTLNGLYLAKDSNQVDNHTAIDHAMPHCESHEVYKGILADRAKGVFNGKIFVRQDAQKTDAKQTNKTLLLSDEAQINTKPQLEIFADDVRCTHGATIGQLDDSQLFYLRARGIPKEEARALLIYAFAGEIVSGIRLEPVREVMDALLFARLSE